MANAMHETSPPNPYEDLDELNGGHEMTPRAPTIDQLLSEIEQECHGPGYKYSPQGGRGPSAEIWEGPRGASPLLRTDRVHLLQGTPFHSKAASFDGCNFERRVSFDSSTDSLPPDERLAVENAVERTFQAYETIPFRLPPSSDDDTYVYMAPYRDAQTNSPQLSQSRYVYT